MPFFRVFGVFRRSLFSATKTPNRPVTLITRGLSPVSCHPYRAGTVPGFLSFSLEEQIIPLAHLE
jgi:hypothetical protein